MGPLGQRVTVILTTSPASDHPRTELLEQVMASFRFVDGLSRCRTIIVCDGYKISNSCNFRGGKVDDVRRANYEGYKVALNDKISRKLPGWECVQILDLQQHHGFGFAVRAALPHVETDVCVCLRMCVCACERVHVCVRVCTCVCGCTNTCLYMNIMYVWA